MQVIKVDSAPVSFRLYNLNVDNIPFIDKDFQLKLHYRYNNFSTDTKHVGDFSVHWSNLIEFTRTITRDNSGRAASSIVDVYLIMNDKDEIAKGKLDLASIVRSGAKHMSIPLQSTVLESNFNFDIDMTGGEMFVEVLPDAPKEAGKELPVIVPKIKKGWMKYTHNSDRIKFDANALADAALRPVT